MTIIRCTNSPMQPEVKHGHHSPAAPSPDWLWPRPPPHWLPTAFAQIGGTTGKLLVGYPAGGTLDTTARQLTEAWRKQGRQYIVDNRAWRRGPHRQQHS
jgi:hypothetical protein